MLWHPVCRLHTSASLDPSMNKEVMGQLESLLADKTRLAQENCRWGVSLAVAWQFVGELFQC